MGKRIFEIGIGGAGVGKDRSRKPLEELRLSGMLLRMVELSMTRPWSKQEEILLPEISYQLYERGLLDEYDVPQWRGLYRDWQQSGYVPPKWLEEKTYGR